MSVVGEAEGAGDSEIVVIVVLWIVVVLGVE